MWNRWFAPLCLALVWTAYAQDTDATRKRFGGDWQAKFNGAPFLTLHVEAGAKVEGTISTGRITVDDNGELTDAEAQPEGKELDLMKVRVDGDRMTFEVDANGELMRFEMRLTGEGKGELRFSGTEVKIKPIRLDRK